MQLTVPETTEEKQKVGKGSIQSSRSPAVGSKNDNNNQRRKRLRTRGSHRRRHSLRRRRHQQQQASVSSNKPSAVPNPVVVQRHHDFYFNVSDEENNKGWDKGLESLDEPASSTDDDDGDSNYSDVVYEKVPSVSADTVGRRLKRFLSGELSAIGHKIAFFASAFSNKKKAGGNKKKAQQEPTSTFFDNPAPSSCGYSSACDLDTTFYSTLGAFSSGEKEKGVRKPDIDLLVKDVGEDQETGSLYSTIKSTSVVLRGDKQQVKKKGRKPRRKAEEEEKISKVDLVNRTVTVERRPKRRGLTRRTSRCACVLRF
jgi:hypothetical protein